MIRINNQYSIFHDKRQWHLMEKVANKGDKKKDLHGKELDEFHKEDKFQVLGYYYRLSHVATKLVNRLNSSDKKDMKDLTEAYDDLIDTLEEVMVKLVDKQKESV